MQRILHNWGDEDCIRILKNCREAVPKENGKVIIVDVVIEEEGGKHDKLKDSGLMLDMAMMAYTESGKQRTLKEVEYLINMAGFSTFKVKEIKAVQSVILAFP